MEEYGLNYLYLSKSHAGGKDQVGLNLLKGFYEIGKCEKILVICYDYSEKIIREIAPNVKLYIVKSKHIRNELERLFCLEYNNTFLVPQIIKKHKLKLMFHLSLNNGWRKYPCKTILLPHDIKAISHRKLPGVSISFSKYWMYRLVYYRDFMNADKIIAISDCDKEEIKEYYPKFAYKVSRIYNPILVKEFKHRSKLIKESYILAVNIQFLHKNTITLIKAYEKICNQIQQKLVLVGNVPKRVEFLKTYVKEHMLEDKVLFTGFVTEEELYCWMINADLYVNPTLFEGFGMTAVEALWQKVPCLVSSIPVNIEVTQGETSYYGPAEDEEALATRILDVLEHSDTIEDRERKAQCMKDVYGYLGIAELYMEYFEKIVDEVDEI